LATKNSRHSNNSSNTRTTSDPSSDAGNIRRACKITVECNTMGMSGCNSMYAYESRDRAGTQALAEKPVRAGTQAIAETKRGDN